MHKSKVLQLLRPIGWGLEGTAVQTAWCCGCGTGCSWNAPGAIAQASGTVPDKSIIWTLVAQKKMHLANRSILLRLTFFGLLQMNKIGKKYSKLCLKKLCFVRLFFLFFHFAFFCISLVFVSPAFIAHIVTKFKKMCIFLRISPHFCRHFPKLTLWSEKNVQTFCFSPAFCPFFFPQCKNC